VSSNESGQGVQRGTILRSSFHATSAFSNIFFILSDEDTLRMFLMISEDRQPKADDLGSRKRFYERLSKLREQGLYIKRKISPEGTSLPR
jgi:hypothetical protein